MASTVVKYRRKSRPDDILDTMNKARGFTIVELLIVIVVIAILAAVTIVAYNGIQNRAQDSAAQATARNIEVKLASFFVTDSTYPTSITACPPTSSQLCVNASDDTTFLYTSNPAGGVGYIVRTEPTYDLAVMGTGRFLYKGHGERTGTNEFMQYSDLAPYIDKYGLRKYELSFDLKSADTSSASNVSVYFQNGSATRYNMGLYPVAATTSYKHYTITFTPTLTNAGIPTAMLAFYGTYSTGNRPYIKDVQLKLAP